MFHPDGPTFFELAEQALSSTERGYDLLAPKFDHTPFRTPDAILDRVAAHLGEPGSIGRALDVCCGTGAAMRAMRPLCRDEIVGIDMSRGMLDEAERRLRDAPGDATVRLQRADALALPFREEFDLAVSFGAFGHILEADEPRFVHNVRRALVPGGRFAFVTSDVPSKLRPGYWLARGFNAAIRARNVLIDPPFVMYYLTFMLPRARSLLAADGFEVEVVRDLFPRPFHRAVLVIATRS
jgi:ubiquinone/menaquinone biosynthesis C-methylase UbiE